MTTYSVYVNGGTLIYRGERREDAYNAFLEPFICARVCDATMTIERTDIGRNRTTRTIRLSEKSETQDDKT